MNDTLPASTDALDGPDNDCPTLLLVDDDEVFRRVLTRAFPTPGPVASGFPARALPTSSEPVKP